MGDAELVRQTLSGRAAAYDQLARRWSARILAFCHAKVGSAEAAEDLAQESLLRGYRALGSLADPEKFGAWLRGIALRVCLDWHKAKPGRLVPFSALGPDADPDSLPAPYAPPEQDLERAEQVQLLMNHVHALPEPYREVLLLYYYQDATYRDLAADLGVSFATVNARLTKARAMLRERMIDLRR